jgi:hypothetical protein
VKKLLLVPLALMLLIACKKGDNKHIAECDGSAPTYVSDVQAIITANCNGCHGSGSSHGDFSTYAGLSTVTTNGKFQQKVLDDQSMPTSGPLNSSDLDKLKCWVENGFPEN